MASCPAVGMALAGCFSMSLAQRLEAAGFEPERIETRAAVQLEVGPDGAAVEGITLATLAEVPRISFARLDAPAQHTRKTCVIARARGGPGRAGGRAPDGERRAVVTEIPLAPPIDGSPLSLALLRLDPHAELDVGAPDADLLLYAVEGAGAMAIGDDEIALAPGTATYLGAGETARLVAAADGLAVGRMAVHVGADEHAPLAPAARVARLDLDGATAATSNRSFQVLFGPENGCCRATLFVGVVPPGAAPWHFHQYDEIVWLLRGRGRYHRPGGVQELRPGSAVRIRPREVHINENLSSDEDMHVLGIFTPAGSPSAAYLARDGERLSAG